MDIIALFIFLAGVVFGSFLNVCIYRIPLNQSIIAPPSYCFHCGTRLRPRDLVPIFSYLVLQGRCRYCNTKFSCRYPFVELLTGCLYVICLMAVGYSIDLVKPLIMTSFLVIITFIDYDYQLILDKVLIWLAGAGLLINLYSGNIAIFDMLYGGLAGGGILLLIAIISRGGMGMGDVKFAAVLGLWFGLKLTVLTLFLSFLLGGIGSGLLLAFRLKGRKDMIPFGPYIATSAFIAMLYGESIIRWYLSFF